MNGEDRDLILRWVAGFFDGEGCVTIHVSRHSHCENTQASLKVTVNNTDRRPIELFCELFPGPRKGSRIKQWLGPKANLRRRVQYEWQLSGVRAYEFCKAILPYSVVKSEQLALAIQFYELPWRSERRHAGGTWRRRTGDQVKMDLFLAQEISGLKRL